MSDITEIRREIEHVLDEARQRALKLILISTFICFILTLLLFPLIKIIGLKVLLLTGYNVSPYQDIASLITTFIALFVTAIIAAWIGASFSFYAPSLRTPIPPKFLSSMYEDEFTKRIERQEETTIAKLVIVTRNKGLLLVGVQLRFFLILTLIIAVAINWISRLWAMASG